MAKKFFFKQFFVSRKTKILEPNFLQKLGVFLDPKTLFFIILILVLHCN